MRRGSIFLLVWVVALAGGCSSSNSGRPAPDTAPRSSGISTSIAPVKPSTQTPSAAPLAGSTSAAIAERALNRLTAEIVPIDAQYLSDVTRARTLLHARLGRAVKLDSNSRHAAAINKALGFLAAAAPPPEAGVHEGHEGQLGPVYTSEMAGVGPSDARAAIYAYKADVEMAHRRWLASAAPLLNRDLTLLTREPIRSERMADRAFAVTARAFELRLMAAKRGTTTAYYRETPRPAAGDTPSAGDIPVALRLVNVKIKPPVMGEQLSGTFEVRTLIAPYNVASTRPGPSTILLIYDKDRIVYYAGGAWNGFHAVGSDLLIPLDTHSNVLVGALGTKFTFPHTGEFTIRLLALNSSIWNDVLDVYDAKVTVEGARAADR